MKDKINLLRVLKQTTIADNILNKDTKNPKELVDLGYNCDDELTFDGTTVFYKENKVIVVLDGTTNTELIFSSFSNNDYSTIKKNVLYFIKYFIDRD